MYFNNKTSFVGKKVFVGIDVHRKTYFVTCRCEKETVKRCQVEAEPEKLVDFLLRHFKGAQIETVYEAGFSGFVLHRKLQEAGIESIVINPGSIEVCAGNKVKTDKRDSFKQAEQLAAGRLHSITIPTFERETMRLVVRSREQLIGKRTRLQNQLRSKFHQFGLIPLHDNRRLSQKMINHLLEEKEIPEKLRVVSQSYLALWMNLNEQIKIFDEEMKHQGKDCPLIKLYRSASGIGPVTASTLAVELGDMSQFRNEKALFSYTGLTPTEYSSGEQRRLGCISRQGNTRLRRVLIECAWVAIRKDRKLAEDYMRISARRGKKRAIVAVARKLIGRIRAAARKGELYQPGHPLTA